MNTILKRVIALVLCFVMTVGYVPVSAFATEAGETVTTETTEVTTEETGESSEETEASSEAPALLAELSEEPEDSDKEVKEAEKEAKKAEKEAEKEAKKAEKEAEKEAKKEEKPGKPGKPEKPGKPGKPGEETVPVTEETVPETTEETIPATEETVPETTEETVPEDQLLMTLEIEDEEDPVAAALEARSSVTVSSDALAKAQTYIDALTINNTSNDPATVVKNFGTHFTWDNEKRENSASYLYDWSYYNGVVFEGLEYLYEVTGKTVYKDYVEEYMSSMINTNGTWATCTNKTSKQCAGYNATHGADCYKTASLLMDLYEMTKDERYQTMAKTLYADLDSAASKYSLSKAGNNYRHTWASDPSPDLWLDGLYMILPFRAEYAKHIGDTEELDLIVSRMQWVSDNMYNEEKGLFYHAADSATSNSGSYWLRAIGWYAAAIVDVMDSMTGDNLRAMQTQLKRLVDGMLLVQNSTNGMWLNNMALSESSTNPYETSGTALVCYAVMKAVNEGWLDESYADMAVLAFNGICSEKLSGTTLKDICFKGAPGSGNSTFYNNEGKGVGPFIMLYAEILEYTKVKPEQPEQPTEPSEPTEPAEPEDQEITVEGTTEGETPVTMTVSGVSAAVTAAVLKAEDKTLLDAHEGIESYVAIDVTGTLAEGEKATFTVAIPEGWDADRVVGISVEEGVVKEIEGTHADGKFTFTVDHFSAKGVGLTAKAAAGDAVTSGTGNLVGGTRYVLDTDGVDAGATYLIVSANSGNASAFQNDDGSSGAQSVTINDGAISSGFTNESTSTWTFTASGTGWNISNGNQKIRLNSRDILDGTGQALTVSHQGDGKYEITNGSRYLRYYYYSSYSYGWTRGGSGDEYTVYLFKKETSNGEAVKFTVTPPETIKPGDEVVLTGTVTVAGNTVDLSKCTITWESSNRNYATVSNGTVTGKADGTAYITATLTAVDSKSLQGDGIKLTIPVTVATKTVKSITLDPASGTVYVGSGDAALTGGKVKITYKDAPEQTVNITVGMLSGEFSTKTKGTYKDLKVTYNDEEVDGTFILNVVEAPDMNYPEYPDPGSVDLDKFIADYSQFQNTGVAEINLTTSGLPAMTGVDVILVTDLSNSMARTLGSTSDSSYVEGQTKLDYMQDSIEAFANIFLDTENAGNKSQNTVSLVTFAGYDADHTTTKVSGYADSCQTLLYHSSSANEVIETANDIKLRYVSSSRTHYLSFDGGKTEGVNYGNTNYDHAFMETNEAIKRLKADYAEEHGISYDESGRLIYVVFMTDGAPSNYNGIYYRGDVSGDRADVYCTWDSDMNPATKDITYDMKTNYKGMDNGDEEWYELVNSNDHNWASYVYYLDGVADIIPVGFDLNYGGFNSWTFSADTGMPLKTVLAGMVTGKTLTTYEADDEEKLAEIYASLASQIKLAATNAYYIDEMGDNFNLQLASSVTKFGEKVVLTTRPKITISTQDIYTPDNAPTTAQIGKPIEGTKEDVEIVVFSDDGQKAYSNQIDKNGNGVAGYTEEDGSYTFDEGDNILVDGIITAKNFWYNNNRTAVTIDTNGDAENGEFSLAKETFRWNIGTINNQEFIMSYYVYLDGSAEGKKEAGTYATNNRATLYYTNWLGNDAEQNVDSPALSWESASVYYGFYLVDENGNPVVNRATGETGPIEKAVKVTTKIFYKEVLLNGTMELEDIQVAAASVPEEYTVYDKEAKYTIAIDSAGTISSWTIENGREPATTYVTDYRDKEWTNVLSSGDLENKTGVDLTSTTVWFAVEWKPSTVPDVVVIDYGLPVDINVMENDMFGSAGKLSGIGALGDKPESLYTTTHSDAFTVPEKGYAATYGTAEMKDGKVRYTPKDMQMNGYDKFAYEAQYQHTEDGIQYYYGDVTVIPATTIYYEDSFVKTSSYTWDNAANNWGKFVASDVNGDGKQDNDLWSIAGNENNNATQAEDRPGKYSLTDANNIYGYDSANLNMSTYSLGSARKAIVNYDYKAEASFEFWGTGFDVISMTSNTTGSIYVAVYDANNNRVGTKKMVDTYYGCKQVPGDADGDGKIAENEVVWVVDPESTDAIYQVPVMKVEGLTYGKYKAVIEVIWEPLYDNIEGSEDYEFYLDAIRIYDPANDGAADGTTDTTIEDAYVADGEGWPSYIELRNKLIAAEQMLGDYDADSDADGDIDKDDVEVTGVVFIDGDGTVGNDQIEDYKSYGPNNEVYLAPGQRVAFLLSNVTDNVAGIHIGIKSADGQKGTYTITNVAEQEKTIGNNVVKAGTYYGARTFTMNTATDMYYDLTGWRNDIIVISNTGNREENNTQGIISITNIKATYKQDPKGVVVADVNDPNGGIMVTSLDEETSGNEVGVYMTPRAATLTLRALNHVVDEPEETLPEESVPETTVPEESVPETTEPTVTEPEESEPEETEPEETQPDKEAEKIQKEIEKALKKAAKEAEKIAKELQKAAEKAAKALSKLFDSWF